MFTAGTDPEFFLKKGKKFVISQNYIDGTKDNPQPLPNGGNVQRDNALIEFAIDPASSKLDYINKINNALKDVIDLLPSDVDIDIIPSGHFTKVSLKHPECSEFGCSPDYNAWTMRVNETPDVEPGMTLRSAGAHEHVGFVKGSGNEFLLDDFGRIMVVRVMDCNKGFMSVILDNNPESIERRKLYGKPGCYRPTSYGVEYRTISNFWLKSPKLVELMYLTTEDSIRIVKHEQAFELVQEIGMDTIQNVILEGDVDQADFYLNTVVRKYLQEETWEKFEECKSKTFNWKEEWRLT